MYVESPHVTRAKLRCLGRIPPADAATWEVRMTSAETAKSRLQAIVKRDREVCPSYRWEQPTLQGQVKMWLSDTIQCWVTLGEKPRYRMVRRA